MIDERAGRPIYFFDLYIKNRVGQRGEDRELFYVRDRNVEMADLGILHKTESSYLFLDPLKYLIPTREITWLGPPDLEFDFYRGLSLVGTPFHREVYAEYHIYKVTGNKVTAYERYPRLLEQNYYGFNLILFHGRVYAIPQSEGTFEIARIEKHGYSHSYQGGSAQEVKKAIDKDFGSTVQVVNKVASNSQAPQLLEQNYRGFNLVSFRGRVYAIPQPEGAFEIEKIEKHGYSRSFQGNSSQEVKKDIDKEFELIKSGSNKVVSNKKDPLLLEENYYGFNLVLFGNRVYAIPQPEGAFEIERIEKHGYSRSFEGNSVQEVENDINKALNIKTDFLSSLKHKIKEILIKLGIKK